MTTSFKGFSKIFLFFTFFISLHSFTGLSMEFQVGGDDGWVVPSKNHDHYNDWASRNRFKVNDTLKFTYKKDSVLVVTEEEYEKCRSAHPIFFSNNGDTIYTLDRSGLFYFISGVSGHCERGLKMIIKVLEIESPPQSANQTTPSSAKSAAATSNYASFVMFIFSLFGAILFV
ncbi:hypothetical protein ACH5RR_025024 [Cinchona calisaya]|uniref:Phytocyanin domain-containing protein n=1 Tax=Cinchona calisaya TaxID=153742 RepID=A0ABD2YYF9_9GENT